MPSNLHGLNIVHPALSSDRGDAHDLLSGPPFPDLSSQLDLWTTLSFDNEDTVVTPPRDDSNDSKHEEDEEERRPASHDSHVNVVTGTVIPNHNQQQPHFQASSIQQQQPGFDLNSFLASFGINTYSQPPSIPSQPQPQPPNIPSLAQLLALHASQHPITPFNTTVPTPATTAAPSSSETPAPPPAKRARSRKSSETAPSIESPEDSSKAANDIVLSAAEDKRRRNTAASARFRLKKKEREAALESRAKELEIKVNELERECEGLRRENGWLKGLVVGVTGAQQQQQLQASTGQKRGREDDS